MCSPLTYSTTNNWIHEPRTCSSIARGTGRNSDQARLMVAGNFFCLCPKTMSLKEFVTGLGMSGGAQEGSTEGQPGGWGPGFQQHLWDRGCSATSRKLIRALWLYLDHISLPFAPRNPRLKQCKFILPECYIWWFSSPLGWTRGCTSGEVCDQG